MIAKSVWFFANRPYAVEYRRFAKNPNPTKQARILAQIGVLQLALLLPLSIFAGSIPIPIHEVTDEMIEAFWSADLSDCTFFFAKKTQIPILFLVKGNFLQLDLGKESSPKIEVIEDFYMKVHYGDVSLSSDLKTWKSLYEALHIRLVPSVSKTELGIEIILNGELSLQLK